MGKHVLMFGTGGDHRSVVRLLALDGVRLTVIDEAPVPEVLRDRGDHCQWWQRDPADPAALDVPGTEAPVDLVVHLVAMRDDRDPVLQHRVNVDSALRLMEWARARGVQRMVLASSRGAGDPEHRAIARNPPDLFSAGALAKEEFARVHARLHGATISVLRLGDPWPQERLAEVLARCLQHDPGPGLEIIEVPA